MNTVPLVGVLLLFALAVVGPVWYMQLSDIHVGHHRGRNYLDKIVEETNQRKPGTDSSSWASTT